MGFAPNKKEATQTDDLSCFKLAISDPILLGPSSTKLNHAPCPEDSNLFSWRDDNRFSLLPQVK